MSVEVVTPDRDEETGRYTSSYPDEKFIVALDNLGGTAGTSEVADQVGCVRDSAYRRLNRLADDKYVERRTIGNSLVWSLTEEGRSRIGE